MHPCVILIYIYYRVGLGNSYWKIFMPHLHIKWIRHIIYDKEEAIMKRRIQDFYKLVGFFLHF